MPFFRASILTAALLALLLGGLQTLLQQRWALPLITAAERYETAGTEVAPHSLPSWAQAVCGALGLTRPALLPGADTPASATSPVNGAGPTGAGTLAASPAHHDTQADRPDWSPRDAAERLFWTAVANTLQEFALVLLALCALSSVLLTRPALWAASARWQRGLWLAAFGFLSLHLWPSLGLPAELPGMDAARLGSRQAWWLLAAGSALLACVAAVMLRRRLRWCAVAGLLALPFLVGAPAVVGDAYAGFDAAARTALQALESRFVLVTHALALVHWLALGVSVAWAHARWVAGTLPSTRADASWLRGARHAG